MNCVQCLHSYNEHSRKINRVEILDPVLDSWIVRAVFFTDISVVFLAGLFERWGIVGGGGWRGERGSPRGGHRHLQIGRMLDIDLISEPPLPDVYVSKVWESVWPEGQEAIHS
jgi:hypothetical protein